MSGRGEQLHATPDDQLGELIDLIATLDDTTLRLPCPGREKLGDGTIAASAQHAVDNYQRIADFVQTSDRMTRTSEPNGRGGHRVPRFLKPSATTRQTTPNTAATKAPVHTPSSAKVQALDGRLVERDRTGPSGRRSAWLNGLRVESCSLHWRGRT